MKKSIIFIIGLVCGVLAVVITIFVLASKQNPNSALIEFTQKEIETDQKRLGRPCSDSTAFYRQYLSALPPIIAGIQNGDRLSPADPILVEFEKVRDVLQTCSRLNRIAKQNALALPTPPEVADEKFETNMMVISLSLAQTVPAWCEQKCIDNALVNLNSSLLIVNQLLAASTQAVK